MTMPPPAPAIMPEITKQVPLAYNVLGAQRIKIAELCPLTGMMTSVTMHFPDGCFLADTPILMADSKERAIQDISIGAKVSCHRWSGEVIHTNERDFTGDIITIKPSGLGEIYATSEHPFLVVPKQQIADSGGRAIIPQGSRWASYRKKPSWEPSWISASELGVGDWLISPIYKTEEVIERLDLAEFVNFIGYSKDETWGDYDSHHLLHGRTKRRQQNLPQDYVRHKYAKRILRRYIDISPQFMRLLGLYIAEGNLIHEKHHTPYEEPTGVCFTFGSHEEALARETLWLIKECFNINGFMLRRREKNTISVTLISVPIAALFQKLAGEHFNGKSIHPILMKQKPELQWQLISGIHDGDSSEGPDYSGIGLRNKNLISEIATLLNRLHLKPAIEKHGEAWGVVWRDKELAKKRFYQNGWLMTPIGRIARHQHKGKVYNLGVNPQNSYVAGKIAVHNCNGLVHVAFGHSDKWVAPSEINTFISLNNASPVLPTSEPVIKNEHLWAEIRNGDALPHFISVIATIIGRDS